MWGKLTDLAFVVIIFSPHSASRFQTACTVTCGLPVGSGTQVQQQGAGTLCGGSQPLPAAVTCAHLLCCSHVLAVSACPCAGASTRSKLALGNFPSEMFFSSEWSVCCLRVQLLPHPKSRKLLLCALSAILQRRHYGTVPLSHWFHVASFREADIY